MPRDLRGAVAFLFGLWLALSLVGPLAAPRSASGEPSSELAALEAELLDSVNRERLRAHRVALARDPVLDRVARAHSADMIERGFFSHDAPDGASPVDRLQRGGATGFSLAGENVGKTNRSFPNREIVQGWLASPVHRENLMAPAFNTTGVGIARAPDGTLFYTQVYVTIPREAR
jgi:uncharacterized protein YkwD